MGYYNLDEIADSMMAAEEQRLEELDMISELEDDCLYLVTMGNYEEWASNAEEVNFLVDEAEARGLECTVEKLDY